MESNIGLIELNKIAIQQMKVLDGRGRKEDAEMIKQVKINKMKNFRFYTLFALLLMMSGTMKG